MQSLIPIVDQAVSIHSLLALTSKETAYDSTLSSSSGNLNVHIFKCFHFCWLWKVVENMIRPCLVELSEDPDVDVRYFANQALQSIDNVMMSS